jgi:L-lysine exporter family protein LysE/ArgO
MALVAHFTDGLLLGLGLFVAPGTKDTLVLRLGLAGGPLWRAVAICVAADAIQIVLGMSGLAAAFSRHPAALSLLLLAGGAYLLWFAGCRLRAACQGLSAQAAQHVAADQGEALRSVARLGFLNPYSWLDTVVLIGPLALARPLAGQPWFALGAMAASLAWFVVLALASARLGGAFQRAWTWRALDLGVTVIVSILAVDIFMDLARRHWTG